MPVLKRFIYANGSNEVKRKFPRLGRRRHAGWPFDTVRRAETRDLRVAGFIRFSLPCLQEIPDVRLLLASGTISVSMVVVCMGIACPCVWARLARSAIQLS